MMIDLLGDEGLSLFLALARVLSAFEVNPKARFLIISRDPRGLRLSRS
jgi:hypothetical protein